MKQFIKYIFVLIIFSVMLTGCGSNNSDSEKSAMLVSVKRNSIVNLNLNKDYKVTVTLSLMGYGDYFNEQILKTETQNFTYTGNNTLVFFANDEFDTIGAVLVNVELFDSQNNLIASGSQESSLRFDAVNEVNISLTIPNYSKYDLSSYSWYGNSSYAGNNSFEESSIINGDINFSKDSSFVFNAYKNSDNETAFKTGSYSVDNNGLINIISTDKSLSANLNLDKDVYFGLSQNYILSSGDTEIDFISGVRKSTASYQNTDIISSNWQSSYFFSCMETEFYNGETNTSIRNETNNSKVSFNSENQMVRTWYLDEAYSSGSSSAETTSYSFSSEGVLNYLIGDENFSSRGYLNSNKDIIISNGYFYDTSSTRTSKYSFIEIFLKQASVYTNDDICGTWYITFNSQTADSKMKAGTGILVINEDGSASLKRTFFDENITNILNYPAHSFSISDDGKISLKENMFGFLNSGKTVFVGKTNFEILQDTNFYTVFVTGVKYSKTSSPETSKNLVQDGLQLLKESNWNAAKDKFKSAKSLDTANNDAKLGYVVTNLALLIDNQDVQTLVDDIWNVYGSEMGIDPSDSKPTSADYLDGKNYDNPANYAIPYLNYAKKLVTKSDLNASRVQAILVDTILPELTTSLNDLSQIFENNPDYKFEVTYKMTPDPYDHINDNKDEGDVLYEIDKPALIAAKSILYALKSAVYFINSYNFDLNDYTDTYIDSFKTKAALIAEYPLLGKLKTNNTISEFKTDFVNALENAKTAIELAEGKRNSITTGSKTLYNLEDMSDTDIKDSKDTIDTLLMYVRDGERVTGEYKIDLDFDGKEENAYLSRLFNSTTTIQDLMKLLPDSFNEDIDMTYNSLEKGDFNFIFDNLEDTAFNSFKQNVNIKMLGWDDLSSTSTTSSFSVDCDNDGTYDLVFNFETSENITVSASSGKKIYKIDVALPILFGSAKTDIDNHFAESSQEVSFSLMDSPNYDQAIYNLGHLVFKTSKDYYALLKFIVVFDSYNSERPLKIYPEVYVDRSTSDYKFWNFRLDTSFELYGSNSSEYIDSGSILSDVEKGKITPESIGFEKIGVYTYDSGKTFTSVSFTNTYNNFMILTRSDSYIVLQKQLLQNTVVEKTGMNRSYVVKGSPLGKSAIFYYLFNCEYMMNDNRQALSPEIYHELFADYNYGLSGFNDEEKQNGIFVFKTQTRVNSFELKYLNGILNSGY